MDLLVIIDKLNKGVILELCSSLTIEAVTKTFIRVFYQYHSLLKAIVLDHGL
jgi:hypothetical protein